MKKINLLLSLIIGISSASLFAESSTCKSEQHHAFDFWIGEWQVKDAKGNVVGENHIFPILKGCALSENWQGAKGGQGKSYNFYDRANQKWHQTWIDADGEPLFLDGNLENNTMVLQGTRPTKENQIALHRITWTLLTDGNVKQHWQVSSDEGKSWSDIFVGFYEKRTK